MCRVTRAGLGFALSGLCGLRAETLYNGIVLPAEWPPRNVRIDDEPPPPPPYLAHPPAVIPIDVGRQLFVDSFLIQRTDLRRRFHPVRFYPHNPVIAPDRPWETEGKTSCAMAFSDGVWYDPADQNYKAWYLGPSNSFWHHPTTTLFATSLDGVHWVKPDLDVQPGTNIVHVAARDSSTVWLDQDDPDPARRFRLVYSTGNDEPLNLCFSADGIHWSPPAAVSPPIGDRTTVFWNPFRKVWVVSARGYGPAFSPSTPADEVPGPHYKLPGDRVRYRFYHEAPTLSGALHWDPQTLVPWIGADRLDPSRVDLAVRPELYNLDATPYESLMLGLFTIWRGQPNRTERDKPNEVVVGFSRDGFHWSRPFRQPFIPVSEDPKAWNYANVQSVGGGCLVVGDRLYFYLSGRAGGPLGRAVDATGLGTLRRDGFISMDAGYTEGTLLTRLVRFHGKYLFVNVDDPEGGLRVEVLDRQGQVIPPFTREDCEPVAVDNTLQRVRWKGAPDLTRLAGMPVQFRFYLRDGSLYSFWVTPDRSGASHGYVAAGGPGFTGPTDTVGSAIYVHGWTNRALN